MVGCERGRLAVLAIEVADMGDKLDEIRRRNRDPSTYAWQQPLHWDAWRSATERYRQMVIVPSAGWDQDTEVAFTLFAGRSGLAINTGSPARVDWSALRRSRDALQRQLADGPLDASTVYVVHPRDIDGFVTAHRGRISCRAIDAFHACVVDDGGA